MKCFLIPPNIIEYQEYADYVNNIRGQEGYAKGQRVCITTCKDKLLLKPKRATLLCPRKLSEYPFNRVDTRDSLI